MGKVSNYVLRWMGNSSFVTSKFQVRLLRKLGAHIGDDVTISRNFRVINPNISIGDNVYINNLVTINNGFGEGAKVSIGDNVQIGPKSTIVCVTHEFGSKHKRAGHRQYSGVTIEEGCWLGANVTILPGVTIDKGCVIGAGATVTKNTEPDGLYIGLPAKRVRDL